jgi:hypothetical protein
MATFAGLNLSECRKYAEETPLDTENSDYEIVDIEDPTQSNHWDSYEAALARKAPKPFCVNIADEGQPEQLVYYYLRHALTNGEKLTCGEEVETHLRCRQCRSNVG